VAETATSYDELPYTNFPYPQTHPDRMAAVAVLAGLEPPPVETCRVLELGSGAGGNLIPMALGLPRGSFVGVDLSRRQTADGQETVRRLGLANVELHALSITDIGASFGRFDYVICHGVFSWVPSLVQDAVFEVCRQHLAPNGVAYISFNIYPGWHLRGLVRELMLFHTAGVGSPAERVRQARAFLDLAARAAGETIYGQLLREEVGLIGGASDTYVFHEHLEDENRPIYFRDFAARAAARGLSYLGEALPRAGLQTLPEEGWRDLNTLAGGDPVRLEQYIDFLVCGTFRKALLCRAEAAPPKGDPHPERVRRLWATPLAEPADAEPDVASNATVEFKTIDDSVWSTNHPLLKAVMVALAKANPDPLAFDGLRDGCAALLGSAPADDDLAAALLRCYHSGMVILHAHPAHPARPGERPLGSPLARLQVARRDEGVTNLRHRAVRLEGFERLVLHLCDGERDRAALHEKLVEMAAEGAFTVESDDGQPMQDPEKVRAFLGRVQESALRWLGANALLVG
jgi:methyltransferase-like protein/SAM-dependent methyltransferase